MGITLIIAGTVLIITFGGLLFEYLGKRMGTKDSKALEARIATLEARLAQVEQGALDRDETVRKLEGELSFMTNLLESRSR
jgi:hypothetical protein